MYDDAQDALAAEYVLGTLSARRTRARRGAARDRSRLCRDRAPVGAPARRTQCHGRGGRAAAGALGQNQGGDRRRRAGEHKSSPSAAPVTGRRPMPPLPKRRRQHPADEVADAAAMDGRVEARSSIDRDRRRPSELAGSGVRLDYGVAGQVACRAGRERTAPSAPPLRQIEPDSPNVERSADVVQSAAPRQPLAQHGGRDAARSPRCWRSISRLRSSMPGLIPLRGRATAAGRADALRRRRSLAPRLVAVLQQEPTCAGLPAHGRPAKPHPGRAPGFGDARSRPQLRAVADSKRSPAPRRSAWSAMTNSPSGRSQAISTSRRCGRRATRCRSSPPAARRAACRPGRSCSPARWSNPCRRRRASRRDT